MLLPGSIDGPVFENGDWVSFQFDEADLSLRLPQVPYDVGLQNFVSTCRDFRGVNTASWRSGYEGLPFQEVVKLSFRYEDRITHDDIAECFLMVRINQYKDSDIASNLTLDFDRLKNDTLVSYDDCDGDAEERAEPVSCRDNEFFARRIPQKEIDWLTLQLYLIPGKYSSPIVLIPVNNRFVLSAYFNFDSIHYPDRQNPYSDELLHQMKLDLFDEFLSHIQVEYSGKTLETIRQLNPR